MTQTAPSGASNCLETGTNLNSEIMASNLKADQRTAAVILAPLVIGLVVPLFLAVGQGINTPRPTTTQQIN